MATELFTIQDFQGETGEEIINHLATRIYAEDMMPRHDKKVFQQFPIALQTIILIIDFDTEVAINSILGFLENSTGLYLYETIDAFDRIEANKTATILRDIVSVMSKYKTSVEDLRVNVNNQTLYSISSFSQTHGEQASKMADEIDLVTFNLYKEETVEKVFSLLANYIEHWKDNLIQHFRTLN